MAEHTTTPQGREIAAKVEKFVREVVVPFERDQRWTSHGPSAEMVDEMRTRARAAGVLTPHIPAGGGHLSHRDTSIILRAAGLSPLGPVAVNVAVSPVAEIWTGAKAPAAPVAPWGPVSPWGPLAPCEPVSPLSPLLPGSPVLPLLPWGPWLPWRPWSPFQPWGPIGPVSPVTP